jgi:hypothetical protein
MHILYWKNISIWVKVSQVSNVAHEPLVLVVINSIRNIGIRSIANVGTLQEKKGTKNEASETRVTLDANINSSLHILKIIFMMHTAL